MKCYLIAVALVFLAACTTPKTVMRNEETGQVAICGGNVSSSLVGGAVGYYIQKSNDSQCEADYLEQGFKRAQATDTEIVDTQK